MAPSIRETFAGGEVEQIILKTELIVSRVFSRIEGVIGRGKSGISGRFFTTESISSSEEAIKVLALNPEFNEALFMGKAVIPKGSTIYIGKAAALFGQPGGGVQIFVDDVSNIAFYGIKPLK